MKHLVIITGPTGIGKTNLSIQIAKALNSEIVSADSRQIYQEMCIGTAVPSPEELSQIKHHLIQTISIKDYYNVSRYEQEALAIIEDLHKQNDVVIVTGGTGLYLEALCKGIDQMPNPEPSIREKLNRQFKEEGIDFLQSELQKVDKTYYQKVDLNNHARLIRALEIYHQTGKPYSSYRRTSTPKRPFNIIKVALDMERENLYKRINLRVDKMIEYGQIQEAKTLFPHQGLSALKTVGYQELFEYFEGSISLEKAIEKIKNSSRKYARKQISWIRRDNEYKWFLPTKTKNILEYIRLKTL